MSKWPYFIKPLADERLLPWIDRLAYDFGFVSTSTFLNELGFDGLNRHSLEFTPPDSLIEVLSSRTGICLDHLLIMSDASLLPAPDNAIFPYIEFSYGYIWSDSEAGLAADLGLFLNFPHRNIIVAPVCDPSQDQHQRELAKAAMSQLRRGDRFVVAHFRSIAARIKEFFEVADLAWRKGIIIVSLSDMISIDSQDQFRVARQAVAYYRKRKFEIQTPVAEWKRKPPRFSREQLALISFQYENDRKTVTELSREYGVSGVSIYRIINAARADQLDLGF